MQIAMNRDARLHINLPSKNLEKRAHSKCGIIFHTFSFFIIYYKMHAFTWGHKGVHFYQLMSKITLS